MVDLTSQRHAVCHHLKLLPRTGESLGTYFPKDANNLKIKESAPLASEGHEHLRCSKNGVESGLRLGLTDDAVVSVDDFVELPDHERHGLYPLDLLLRADEFSFQVLHLVFDVLLLNVAKRDKTKTKAWFDEQ